MLRSTTPQNVAESFLLCREETRKHARTFYFASFMLPAHKRMSAYALYAFCRFADNVVDSAEGVSPSDLRSNVKRLYDDLGAVYKGGELRRAELIAFRATVREHGIPEEYFHFLLKGIEMDLTKHRYERFAELEEYCFCVASSVGLAMTHVFGNSTDAALGHAKQLGIAMQLTNILRDIREDYRMGRIYLPAEDMRRFGVTEDDLRRGEATDQFRQMVREQAERARYYYRAAEPGIAMLPDDGSRLCVRLMSALYSSILDRIQDMNYNVLAGRAYVPFGGKVAIALRTALREHRQRRNG